MALSRQVSKRVQHKANVGLSLLAIAVDQSMLMSTDTPLCEQDRSHISLFADYGNCLGQQVLLSRHQAIQHLINRQLSQHDNLGDP
jgi:hypothetical protein